MTTELGMFVAFGFLLALEVWSFVNKRKKDTISEITWRAAFRRPLIPFMAGLLCGHLFWPSESCREILMEKGGPMPGPAKGFAVEPKTSVVVTETDEGSVYMTDLKILSMPVEVSWGGKPTGNQAPFSFAANIPAPVTVPESVVLQTPILPPARVKRKINLK